MTCSRSPYKKGKHLWNAGGQCQWCKVQRATPEQLRAGATRERRRIRRAQAPLLRELEHEARDTNNQWLWSATAQLVAKFSAPPKKARTR